MTKKKKTVKAWAVIDPEILKKDGQIFCLLFNRDLGHFSKAIWDDKDHAEGYAERISKGYKAHVVPCTITYEI